MSLRNFSLRKKPKPPSPSTPEILNKNEGSASLKRGDEKRIMLMNMVKEGKLSVDNALQRAYGMGIASVPYEELDPETTFDHKKEGEIYNFGVHRYGSNNKAVKCVIQIDCKEDSLSLLQRGQKLKSYPLKALKNVISGDDSTRLLIQFDDLDETEIDASTLEEKNRIARLLLMVIGEKHTGVARVHSESILNRRQQVIKEGLLEKKGHSAAFLMWPKRFLRILPGEMIYFKVGEENNESAALSIVSLKNDETFVRKLDDNGFLLVTNHKEYAFRVSSNRSEEIEKERNDWIIALQEAIKFTKAVSSASNNEHEQQGDNPLFHQEEYLKSIARSLNEELEQLGVMLNIIDAPIRASTQVKKVREIVHSLNDQINTGLLSWTLKHAQKQRLSMAEADVESEGMESWNNQLQEWNIPHQQQQPQQPQQQPGQSYSHLALLNKQEQNDQLPIELYNKLYLTVNQFDANSLSAQSDLSNDSRYSPYPNYRAPSITSEMSVTLDPVDGDEETSIAQYVPRSASSREASLLGYARVKKSGIKQKQTYSPYMNIDRRNFDMNTWNDEPPPLPPKIHPDHTAQPTDTSPTIGSTISLDDARTPQHLSNSGDFHVGGVRNIDKSTSIANAKRTEFHSPEHAPGVLLASGNVPAPPPLPNMAALNIAQKEDTVPNCKMKPLFWTKVPNVQLANTIWNDAQDRLKDINTDKLESMFHLTQHSFSDSLATTSIKEDGQSSVKSLLDPKKAQNLGIFLSGFKMTEDDIEERLSIFDESDKNALTLDELNALKRFQPTAEEVEMFKTFTGDRAKLVKVDQFVRKLSIIPNINARLDVLLTIREIPEQVKGIEPPINNVLEACKSLRNNKGFVRLLEYILSLGNYLNGGTNRGRAYGFRLTALVKLVEIRSGDKKHTALQFLAEELYTKDQDALMCYKEMPTLLTPTDISIKGLTAEVEIMSKDIDGLSKQIVGKMSENFDETFIDKANEFLHTYTEKLSSLREKCDEVVRLSSELKRMYGENQSSDFENWLNHVSDFLKQLQRAAESAEQKQRRLSRQKLSSVDVPIAHPTVAPMNSSAIAEDSTSKTLDGNWNKNSKKRNESYEKITTHSTKMLIKSTTELPTTNQHQQQHQQAAKLYSVNKATVMQLRPAESTEELSFPTKSGFLEKESGGKKRTRKWDYRFFELTTTGYLHYSKKQDGKLSGAVYLRGCPVQINASDPCVIEIHHEQRLWKLRGDNDLEVMDWYRTLTYYAGKESIDVFTDDE